MPSCARAPDRVSWPVLGFAVAFCLLAACQPASKRVEILVDGQRRVVETTAATVDEVLRAEKIQLGTDDRVDPPGYTPIERTATIRIVRVQIKTIKTREPIPFERQITRDEALAEGQSRVLQLGANGEAEVTAEITYEDGKQVLRRETGRVVVTPPRDQLMVIGTRNSLPTVPIRGTIVYLAHGNAWLMRESSADKRALTFEGDLDGRVFDLSPDGRYLLFTRADPTRLNSLWVVDTAIVGDKPRPVPLADLLYAQWAADGSNRIAYSTGERTPGAPGWKARNDLYIASLPGLTASGPITETLSPGQAGSARGEQISVTARPVISPSVPAPYGWWGSSLAWSPDGQVFAYGLSNQVGIINAARGTRRAVKTFSFYDTHSEWVWTPQVTWSPDSRFVAATVHAPPEGAGAPEDSALFDVYVLARDGSADFALARRAGMWAAPVWSPADAAGKSRIAYGVTLNAADSERARYALYIADRDGSNKRRIFPKGGEDGVTIVQLAWSRDASQLVALREGDLWLYDLGNNSWAQLTANGDTRIARWK